MYKRQILLASKDFINGDELFNKSPSAILDNSSKTFDKIEPGAIGSLVALICVVCGLGYGGLTLFNQMQKVQIAPADATPIVLTELNSTITNNENIDELAPNKITNDQLDRLYRPQAAVFKPIAGPQDPSSDAPQRIGRPGGAEPADVYLTT